MKHLKEHVQHFNIKQHSPDSSQVVAACYVYKKREDNLPRQSTISFPPENV